MKELVYILLNNVAFRPGFHLDIGYSRLVFISITVIFASLLFNKV